MAKRRNNRNALILQLARQMGIRDPKAALAVASSEGLSGAIGDSGHAFGPWQLNDAGGVLTGRFPHLNARQKNAWAWSPAGLKFALAQIKRVAGNRAGQDAVANIVNRFERPSAPGPEIQRALAFYGRGGGGGNPAIPSGNLGSPSTPGPSVGRTLAEALIQGQDVTDILPQLRAARMAAQTPPDGVLSPPNATQPQTGGFTPAELFYRDMALKFGKHIGPVKGHYDHVHVAYTNPQAVLAAISLARSLGLHVGENPYVGGVAPVHVSDSYHYRKFPGKYHGRRLGEAADVSGNPAAMLKFYQALAGGR